MAKTPEQVVNSLIDNITTAIKPEIITKIVIGAVVLTVLLVFYTLWIRYQENLESKKKRYFLRYIFDDKKSMKTNHTKDIFLLFNRLHSLSKNGIITFEIHKINSIDPFTGFLISGTSQEIINSISSTIKSIQGVTVLDSVVDFIDPVNVYFVGSLDKKKTKPTIKPKKKIYQSLMVGRSFFGTYKKGDTELFGSICDLLDSVQESNTSIIFTFRRSFFDAIITSKIRKINYESIKKSKDCTGIDHNTQDQIKNLEEKNQSLHWKNRIVIISDDENIKNNIESCFNILFTSHNNLIPKKISVSQNQIRYIPKENFYKYIIPRSFGNNFNCSEISSMIQFVNYGNEEVLKNIQL
jgi:hypothetical protein